MSSLKGIRVRMCKKDHRFSDEQDQAANMEPSSQPQPAIGDAAGGSQLYPTSAYPPAATVAGSSAYPPAATVAGSSAYPPAATVAVATGVAPAGSQPAPPIPTNPAQLNAQNQLIYEQAQQFNQQQRQLQQFWAERLSEIEQVTDFKNHILPLARIKKIMRADEDVRMISAEAPVVFAKACEIFILELTLRSWMHTEENKRRTLQKNDLAAAITRTDVYDFLVDIFPRDETREEGIEHPRAGQPPLGPPADMYPYYYPLQLQVPGAVMGYGSQQMPQGHSTYAWHDPHEQQQQGHQAEQQQGHQAEQ